MTKLLTDKMLKQWYPSVGKTKPSNVLLSPKHLKLSLSKNGKSKMI